MNDDIIRMAREAGIDAEADTLCRYEGWVKPLERFAALVLANNPPQSSMAWQEGFEAGRVAEREAIIDLVAFYGGPVDLEAAIRARGNT